MTHHRPPNKPRSLHRQLSGRTSLSTSITTAHVPSPTALEHSLDVWFSRSSSSSSNNSVSSEKSGERGFYGTGNGNHLTQSPMASAMTTRTQNESTTSPSPPPQPRLSSSVPVITLAEQPTLPSPQASCPCCQLIHCQSWKTMTRVIRKLETETRLAAEIGQSLLQKNEAYLMESNQLKEQLKQCEDRKQELEISLDDTERRAQKLKHEKDKWMWQYEKSEKILNESVADLENTNLKCAALANDLEQTKIEVEKLELLKYKSHQSNTREDTLQSKLEDTMQELMISRKTELALESKYKKLLARYGSLSSIYQDVCKDSHVKKAANKHLKTLSPTTADIQQASIGELVTFIKELLSTNDNLKSKLLNTTIQLDDTRNELNTLQDKYHNTSNTTRGNAKLLAKQTDQSNNNKHPTTIAAIEEKKSGDNQSALPTNGLRRSHSASSCTPGLKRTQGNTKSAPSQSSSNKKTPNIPQSTTSTPVVHHHYHYYLRQRQQDDGTDGLCSVEINDDIVSAYCDDRNCMDSGSSKQTPIPMMSQQPDPFSLYNDTNMASNDQNESIPETSLPTPLNHSEHMKQPQRQDDDADDYLASVSDNMTTCVINNGANEKPTLALSPSSSTPIPTKAKTTTTTEYHSTPQHSKANNVDFPVTAKYTPYSSLLNQATSVLQRLRSTDTRILNRRLQRAFDIRELSNRSNAIIQNIMADVDTMDTRFFWLAPGETDAGDGRCNESVDENDLAKNGLPRTVSSLYFLVNEFFPIVRLLKEILTEMGQLYITINHLQVAYVKKVEENDERVEKEVMGKHHDRPSGNNTITNANSSITMGPSLISSNSTSTPLSCTTSFTFPSTEHIKVNPVNWLSSFFSYDIGNTKNLQKAATYHQPTMTATPNDINHSTTTTGVDDWDRTNDRRQKGLKQHYGKILNSKKPNHLLQQHRQQQQQQQYHSSRFTEYHNHNQIWPAISSIKDEWTQTTIKQSFSSSLDREWFLDIINGL